MARRLIAVMACCLLLSVNLMLPAPAAVSAAARITKLSVDYEVRSDGVLEVTETIDYDYGSGGFPLVRAVRLRQPSDGHLYTRASERGIDRVWEVFDVTASSPTGANADLEMRKRDPTQDVSSDFTSWDSRLLDLQITIGDNLPYILVTPDAKSFPSRPETFVLRYRVRGALDRLGDEYALNRQVNLLGNYSDFGQIDARLTAPAELISVTCAGHRLNTMWDSWPCRSSKTPREARFTMAPTGDGHPLSMEVVNRLGTTGITQGGAILDESPAPRSARIRQFGLAVLIAAGLTIVLAVARRRAR